MTKDKCAYHKKPLGACYQCISDGIVEAVAQMQERCAEVADTFGVHGEAIAAAIRKVKP